LVRGVSRRSGRGLAARRKQPPERRLCGSVPRDGHKALSGTAFTEVRAGDDPENEPPMTEKEVSKDQYASVLREGFGTEGIGDVQSRLC
jgi:hypothetical protein